MKITCFGLNCSAPEDLIQSLRGIFKNKDFENELIRRKIGFVVYANLNDRRKVHSRGFDRSTDNAQVSNKSCFYLNCRGPIIYVFDGRSPSRHKQSVFI